MIDQIVGLILREARGRPGKDRVGNIYAVMEDLEKSIIKVIENVRFIERRKEENEKETRNLGNGRYIARRGRR